MNIFNNDNNIYFGEDYNLNLQQESPKFNSRYNEDIHSSIQTNENLDMEKFGNATYGPFLNEINNINMMMSGEPVIYQNDQEQNLNLNQTYKPNLNYDINNYEGIENIENNLIYSQ